MKTNQLIIELTEALKSCLPTMDDAFADAQAEAETKPAWKSVVSAYGPQISRIRSLIQRVESQ